MILTNCRSTISAMCTENLNADIVVMKPAKDGVRFDAFRSAESSERPEHLGPMTNAF